MSGLVDRITAVLRQHYAVPHGAHYWRCAYPCDWKYGEQEDHAAHVAERVAEALQPELGELEATKLLLAATQEQHRRTIADFCAVRDALPRKQVEQILAAVEEKP